MGVRRVPLNTVPQLPPPPMSADPREYVGDTIVERRVVIHEHYGRDPQTGRLIPLDSGVAQPAQRDEYALAPITQPMSMPPAPVYRSSPPITLYAALGLILSLVAAWYTLPADLLLGEPTTTINGQPIEGGGVSAQSVPSGPIAPLGVVLGSPSLTPAQIDEILAEYGSPAAGTGQIWWDQGVEVGIDPAYAVAFFIHESSAGANPAWAGWKDRNSGANTHNVGNIICAGYATCFGRFRDYPGWYEGIDDWYRLISVEYIAGRGHRTVADIIPVYAPSFENDVQGYVDAVLSLVDQWRKRYGVASTQAGELWAGATVCAGTPWHEGAFDWCAPQGTAVYAPHSGTFMGQGVYTDPAHYGAYVMFRRDDGLEIYLGHLNMDNVNPLGWQVGDRVNVGDQVGELGPFPLTEPHTHAQLTRNGNVISEAQWWSEWGAK